MRVENLAELCRGELQTNPSVSKFEGFCYEADKVKRGDLYLAIDSSLEQINIAIENGAYGILYEEHLEISDSEIAWIQVHSINVAISRLLRYQSAYKKLVFIAVSKLQENILKSINLPKSCYILPKKLIEAFVDLMSIEDGSFIFCSDELSLKNIAPVHENIFTEQKTIMQKNHSIFTSSFIHENEYYQKVQISPLFVPALSGVLSFLKRKKIEFSLENFSPIENFRAIFVDSNIKPQPFGTTIRALIVESDIQLFKYEAKSLLKLLPQNHLLICKPINSSSTMDANFLYKNLNDLKELKSYNFKYALVLGNYDELLSVLGIDENKRYPSLF